MGIQICQTETVYRYHNIDRGEAIRILTEETDEPIDTAINLATLTDSQLCKVIEEQIDEGGEVWNYFDSSVVESDSGTEWTVEVTS